ncbi:MAG: GTPase Era [Candidatus Omnitrophica bacterium]|nr:GTPase Era [Candidatus Omnitrophota bacterium]MBU1128429.1 GTPase Era [Candidatus Omnitrophota bacterium]MBU1784979.1 GTPase Era [Candidatus Omnitrophota bacterium]MBU1851792.1 GTPase Era [Candidatus Omnitrophota bacterium]
MEKSGYVAIAGQPNVGKSTLLNGLLKKKLAIISRRPETTRDNIRGILTEKNLQIIFTDTPGIHRPHNLLGKVMLTRAQSSLLEADIILLVTEKRFALGSGDMNIISRFPEQKEGKTVILVINKVDRIKQKRALLPIIEGAKKKYPFAEIIPMSALDACDLEKLMSVIKSYLPEQPFLYPKDQLTDKSDEFMIQEIIREKILTKVYEEVPHSVAVVVTDTQEDEKTELLNISATIFVERTSQKPIIIGKSGMMIRNIGKLARVEIEELLNRRVYLDLWVKVRDKWKKDPNALEEMGYG